ncbi:MAG: M23 family metallopeptidase [Rikenellaceae bacterium]
MLQGKIGEASGKLSEIHRRDKGVYRAILGVDSVEIPEFVSAYDIRSEYKNNRYASMLDDSWNDLNNLSLNLLKQSISFDTLQVLSSDKGKMLESLPAIWPIDKKLLRGNIGAFGRRVHPIFRYVHFHEGADLAARKGSPVYATAQGKVISSGPSGNGYGISVLVDHGFGYKTRYAHLSKTLVKAGQEVIRGMEIAKVGSTGNSNGPHLHYEVIYRGQHVNPLNYFSKEMRDDDFYKIINSAKETTYE